MSFTDELADIGNRLKDNAMPVLGQMMTGQFGAAALNTVATALGIPNATAKQVRENLTPDNMIRLQELENEAQRSAEQHKLAMEAEQTKRQQSVNETMRAELDNDSTLKSGWRGFGGWGFMFVVCLAELALIWVILFVPDSRGSAVENLFILFGIHGTVIGIDMNRVGRERLALLGHKPEPGLYSSIKARVAPKK